MSRDKEAVHDAPIVLIIDDEDVFRSRLGRAFRERGWETHDAASGERALEIAAMVSPDLVLLDQKMPEGSGLDLIERIKGIDATITVIMLTGYGSIATAMQAMKLGADHYLGKPVDIEQILAVYNDLRTEVLPRAIPTTVPTLARVEWEHVQRVLADCSGNISQTAKLLGLHRRSLQRKLAKYPPQR